MPSIFIETTIHVERLLGEPAVQSVIENIIRSNQAVTSSYVWMEFHRTIGQDYAYLLDLFRQQSPATVPQLIKYIGNGESLFSLRRIKRIFRIVAKILEQIDIANFDPSEVADLLEAERDWILSHQFFDNIDQMIDLSQCDLIQPTYTVPSGGRMSCRRETARCSLVDLLDQNSPSIQNLCTDGTTLHALDVTTQRALSEIISNPTLAKGERNCWALGDLIITLECPADAALWTTNVRHFEPLCNALSRQLFQSADANKIL